jgi:microcystin-dependent protein
MAEPFIAEVRIWGLNYAPRGWAFCNGQLLPVAQHTALFSLVGTIYGGDGRTNFGLPNLQGRAPMGAGNGPGLTHRRLGEAGGATDETLSLAQMPNHNHGLVADEEEAERTIPANDMVTGTTEAANRIYTGATGTPTVNMATESLPRAGGGQAHNNQQPLLGLSFTIALVGVYPSTS